MLRASTSTSPDCSAVKRSFAVSATNFTLVGSLKIAAASARQKSTSRPVQLPCASGRPKPRERAVGAAIEHAARLDGIERLGRCRRGGNSDRRREGELGYGTFHDLLQSRGHILGSRRRSKTAGCRQLRKGRAPLQGVNRHCTNSHAAPECRISERSHQQVKGLTVGLLDAVNAGGPSRISTDEPDTGRSAAAPARTSR